MTEIVRIGLSDEAVEAIADRLAERLKATLATTGAPDRWMNSRERLCTWR